MQDIRHYTENELSLLVFNTYDLYIVRHSPVLFNLIDRQFKYNARQMQVLLLDLEIDYKEVNNNKGVL